MGKIIEIHPAKGYAVVQGEVHTCPGCKKKVVELEFDGKCYDCGAFGGYCDKHGEYNNVDYDKCPYCD